MEGIAIIGMAGKFPGAKDVDAFWRNLAAGVESLTRFADDELEMRPPPDAGNSFVPVRGILEDAAMFDAGFFNIRARDAEVMDPQQRMFLECTWEALEDAGYDPDRFPGLIGVWAGASFPTYLLHNLCADRSFIENLAGNYQYSGQAEFMGNDANQLATRVAYKLNLRGPALTVQTACSTSLVAVAQACQALLSYQTDIALAGGVSITCPQRRGYIYQEGAMTSADGHCRAFDAGARGTIFSNGAGVVVLKRMAEAMADGDRIIACIKGTAVNNDGAGKMSFTAPSAQGQAEVILMAQALAGVSPESISYVEAHGTATPLGDPIEFAGLVQAFRADANAKEGEPGAQPRTGYCALGSVKTNIGHLEQASGVAALIKTALALNHRLIPPSLHFRKPNPQIDLANSPFFVNTALLPWVEGEDGAPRRAGVSSFGVGGTNAHAVLEEAPAAAPSEPSARSAQLLVLSARSEAALDNATSRLAARLRSNPALDLSDVSFTLQAGRRPWTHRRVVVVANVSEAATALETRPLDPKRVLTGGSDAIRHNPLVAFLFPGQGAQVVGMGAGLYRTEPAFRNEIDRCTTLLEPFLGLDLREVLYPAPGGEAEAEKTLRQTRFTQPALFVFGYALARLWMSWGVQPRAMLGHSVGEYVAACLAGVMSLDDALRLVAERARLVQALPGGVMLAVRLPEAEILLLLDANPALSLAAVNSPGLCVVSGPESSVEALEKILAERRVPARRLQTSHAFHSAMMDPVIPEFISLVESMPLSPPQIPFISNVTGQWITDAQATDPKYWARHLREAVRFNDGVGTLLDGKQPAHVLLELGPAQTLGPLARQHPSVAANGALVLSSLQEGRDESETILTMLGRLWMAGVEIDWNGFHAAARRCRVALPTYPFERQRYWVDPVPAIQGTSVVERTASDTPLAIPNPSETCPSEEPANTTPPVASMIPIQPALPADRKPAIIGRMKTLLKKLSGQDQSTADPGVSFLELGFDSLFLTQVAQLFRKEFGVKVTFRQLLEDYPTMDALAGHLDTLLPPDPVPVVEPVQAVIPAPVAAPSQQLPVTVAHGLTAPTASPPQPSLLAESTLERVIQEQLRVMAQQLEMLRGGSANTQPISPEVFITASTQDPARITQEPAPMPSAPRAANVEPKAFGPYRPIERGTAGGFTEKQQAHLDALISQYVARTPRSKQQTQENRAHLADPRTVSGFKTAWKEAVYPLVVERSRGSRMWDIDGNEYVDMTMGFGTNLLGHSPAFVTAALEEQLARGIEVGPQSIFAGKVAGLLCELTGAERAAFTNTGSEAILAAVRLARTVTGRTRIATCGGFHGINDEVLVRAAVADGKRRSLPISPGIPEHIVSDVLVLDYGAPESLELLRAHAHELAAVLVEPVQSRRPDLQPREWLHEVRRITEAAECTLVFDEIITGFRCDLGGAQAHFGVKADIMTYGKIIGGGMPIGAVAGKAMYLDALDGGAWQYGDNSFPEVGVTFFAGTYIRHPLTMAAAWSVLNHLKGEGGGLQRRLNERTKALADDLNGFLETSGVPLHIERFSSMMYPHWDEGIKHGGLLYLHLRARGIHIWEGRVWFLSTAHTDEDVASFAEAFKASIREMQRGGFLPGEVSDDEPASLNRLAPAAKLGANGHYHGTNGNGANGTARIVSGTPVPALERNQAPVAVHQVASNGKRPVRFSLYFFGNYPAEYREDKYRLIIESAKFADKHDFEAVWLPERHFHAVGGFSPNPSLLAAALSRETTRLQLRGGSVVLPLHHPVRVAEEWSVVDNLSGGRTGISIATGWHPNDFIFAPERFERRREICLDDIQTIQKLWRGETLPMRAGAGADFDVRLFPQPVQPRLPVWLTCIGEDAFVKAGELGMNVLGYLMNQTIEEVAAKIAKYREARARHGHDPVKGQVTILVHTFVGVDADAAREQARGPLRNYLRSFLDNSQKRLESQAIAPVSVDEEDVEYLLDKSFYDYVRGKALIGSLDSCADVVDRLREIGVDEIGCFVDFGVDAEAVLASLPVLDQLRARYADAEAEDHHRGHREHGEEKGEKAENRVLPLPEAQSGLWVLGQTDDTALRAYTESTTLEWRGLLDVDALRRALQLVVDRHEALRTTIGADGESQTVHARVNLDLRLLDLSECATEQEREARLAECWRQLESSSFDFEHGPIVKAQLVRLSAEHHLLALTFHHLLGNGPSYFVVLEELTALYDTERAQQPAGLEAPMQLADFVAWRVAAGQETQAEDEAFWLERFNGGLPTLELPADHARPSLRSHRGARRKLRIGRELTSALRKTAAAGRGSLFMVLLSAFEVLLHRLSGQDDVVVGVPFEGEVRSLPGGDHLFANTTNVMPLRSRVGEETKFHDLFAATKDFVFEANEHQNYFFGRLLKKLGVSHDPSRSPMFATFFNYESGRFARDLDNGRMQVTLNTDGTMPYRSPRDTSMFELYLNVAEQDGELLCECDYSTDLFEAETVSRWLGHYEVVLQAIAGSGGVETNVWKLPLLDADERRQILIEWNATQASFPLEKCVHELIGAQIKLTPRSTALIFEGQSLTYAELGNRSSQLAGHLRGLGIGPGSFVGVCMERSFEMVIALLGILKAGGAYVPLDPDYPAERLAFIAADAKAAVVLTQERLVSKLPPLPLLENGSAPKVICLDRDLHQISLANGGSELQASGVGPDDPAYVIYTSGSTGQPKGVANTHRAICNRLHWKQSVYPLTPQDRLVQKTPFSFDVSVPEFFAPLMVGATMVIARPRAHGDSGYLVRLIEEQGVTDIHFVPSLLSVFLEERDLARRCASLRRVNCSGEALTGEQQERFFAIFPRGVQLLNLYGPTEAAVEVTFHECSATDGNRPVPIGRPVANTQTYLLDRHGEPVPIGLPGELLLGGVQVARGYLNRPELTGQRFIADPFSDDPQARLYKTGDLARWQPDGSIAYLGRLDHQVKLRGFRIELEEIEARLNRHPGIRESIVTVREDKPGEQRLVAYIVAKSEAVNGSSEDGDVWHSHWENMHSQGIEDARKSGSNRAPLSALLEGMKVRDLSEQEGEILGQTLGRIRALRPVNVLEIGVGTGDIALALAPECGRYVATDFSQAAIDYLHGLHVPNMRLLCCGADDFTGIGEGEFDTVIIHSVSQYLPDVAYFRRMIEGAVRATRPGGHVYVGDVQIFSLLEAHHTGEQSRRAPASLPVNELRERIRRRVETETELMINPGFFHGLQERLPAVGTVEIELRRGRLLTEMTRVHYDVTLHIGKGSVPEIEAQQWLRWMDDALTLDTLRERLTREQPKSLGISRIPNARLQWEMAALEHLAGRAPSATVGDLRDAVANTLAVRGPGIDPEDLWDLGNAAGYYTAVNWSADAAGADGCCAVIFHRLPGVPKFPRPVTNVISQPLETFANKPRQTLENDKAPDLIDLSASLRAYLKEALPEYMVPAAFVTLERFPLSPAGKVDRRALPAPVYSSAQLSDTVSAPVSPLEHRLAAIWQRLLGVKEVSATANFFELGGDSLMGLRMINQLRELLGEHLSLVLVFETPTIRLLAEKLEANYPEAIERACGLSEARKQALAQQANEANTVRRISEEDVSRMRVVAGAVGPAKVSALAGNGTKNPRAIFVLSPMRSGSTLLRIMLAGHPQLFSPPELQLLGFDTLAERSAALTGFESSMQEGTVRAVMQACECDADEAHAVMRELEAQGTGVRQFYRQLQSWVAPRTLVDKTPEYAMDVDILRRAEEFFEGALYVHLARHPLGMIRSYEKGGFFLESPYRGRHDFSARGLAELTWLISHRNILKFLEGVPAERQMRVRFEDILAAPQSSMETLAGFLGVGFDPGMIRPYENGSDKMTDGVHAMSAQVGDFRYYQHGALKSEVADQWKAEYTHDFLGGMTWELAARLGYNNPFTDTEPGTPMLSRADVVTPPAAKGLPSLVAVSRDARRVKRSVLSSSPAVAGKATVPAGEPEG